MLRCDYYESECCAFDPNVPPQPHPLTTCHYIIIHCRSVAVNIIPLIISHIINVKIPIRNNIVIVLGFIPFYKPSVILLLIFIYRSFVDVLVY